MEAATTELRNSLQEESEANVQVLQEIYTKVRTSLTSYGLHVGHCCQKPALGAPRTTLC
jgi:hypothetical protein